VVFGSDAKTALHIRLLESAYGKLFTAPRRRKTGFLETCCHERRLLIFIIDFYYRTKNVAFEHEIFYYGYKEYLIMRGDLDELNVTGSL